MQASLDDYRRGAEIATRLANTAPEVMTGPGDAIADPDALLRFLAAHDLRPDALHGGRRPSAAEVADVHRVRGALRALIERAEAADPDGAVARAGALAADAGTGPTLVPDAEGRWRWQVRSRPDAGLAGELALLAATGLLGVIRALGHDRFRRCASPVCNGVFADSSRGGRRRYCEPEVCGNRINVANYRSRRRAGAPASDRRPGE